MNPDIFDNGTPKYSTALQIYEALQELASAEEIEMISQIAPDVSYEQQDYYYQDKGLALFEKFKEMSNYGNAMWLLDIAVMQLDAGECGPDVNDLVYEALHNPDLAKRLGFKKLFCDYMLNGWHTRRYEEVTEAYAEELGDLNRFSYWSNAGAFDRVLEACEISPWYHHTRTPYGEFVRALENKVTGLRLEKEKVLIVECRSFLTSYDDFIMGLRMNQALYEEQERAHSWRMAELKAGYEQKLNLLLMVAEKHGLLPAIGAEMKLLENGGNAEGAVQA